MIKILLTILIISNIFASLKELETKIDKNKTEITKIKQNQALLDKQLKKLAQIINTEEEKYSTIVSTLNKITNKLFLNRLKLENAKKDLENLKQTALSLEQQKHNIEENIINFIIKKYSMTMGLEQAKKKSLKSTIDKEVYSVVLENVKQELLNLNIDYLKVNKNKRENQDKIKNLETFIQKQYEIKQKYLKLKQQQENLLASLNIKHKEYQQSLQTIIDKQNKLTDLLGTLNILKKKEIEAEQLRIKKEKEKLAREKKELARQKALAKKHSKSTKKHSLATKHLKFKSRKELDDNINIEVRKIGSSAKGIKIAKYRGIKTIAPLKSYIITKKFGTYYDPVYKMKLFNESVSLKTKIPNAKVFNVLKGKIVYAKENSGLLDNVVIVKHNNNLHTIYAHLDKISPTLKVGKWIPKGYVVGRVNDTLQFQATKDSKYIDPIKLFKR